MDFISNLEKQDHSNIIATRSWILNQIPVSKISDALVDEYWSEDCIAVVIDEHIDIQLIIQSYKTLCLSGKMLIFDISNSSTMSNPSNRSDLSTMSNLSTPSNLITVVQMPPQYYIRLLSRINVHIVTGSCFSWWMASIAEPDRCTAPTTYPIGYYQFPELKNCLKINHRWSYSLWFDHIYYINLEKRTDRRQTMEEQLQKWNLTATRVIALDGSALKWSAVHGIESMYWNTRSLGYCVSYRVALLDADQKYNKVLILDDDAAFTDDFDVVLNCAGKTLPKDWRMLYFGGNHGENIPTTGYGDNLMRLHGSYSSHAIILNKTCYAHFLDFLRTPYGPLDVYFSVYHRFFPCYVTVPRIAYQAPGYSDIICKDVNYCLEYNM
jgi:hypothetical protein